MALPDLDTGTVSQVAYWNAIDDGGASSIDPAEVVSNGNVTQYTSHSNGVTGQFNYDHQQNLGGAGPYEREFNFRIKTDGWFVVYIDRTQNTGLNLREKGEEPAPLGYTDILKEAMRSDSTTKYDPGALSETIQTLYGELSNSGSIAFSHSDVGTYNYDISNATSIEVASEQNDSSDNISGGLSYDNVTREYHHVQVGMYSSDNEKIGFTANDNLINATGSVAYTVGKKDVLADGLMPQSGVTYNNSGVSNDNQSSNITHLIMYS